MMTVNTIIIVNTKIFILKTNFNRNLNFEASKNITDFSLKDEFNCK